MTTGWRMRLRLIEGKLKGKCAGIRNRGLIEAEAKKQGKLQGTGASRRNRESHHLHRHGEVETLIQVQDVGKSSGTVTVTDSARS